MSGEPVNATSVWLLVLLNDMLLEARKSIESSGFVWSTDNMYEVDETSWDWAAAWIFNISEDSLSNHEGKSEVEKERDEVLLARENRAPLSNCKKMLLERRPVES